MCSRVVLAIAMLGCLLGCKSNEITKERAQQEQRAALTGGMLYGEAMMENLLGRLRDQHLHIVASCVTMNQADELIRHIPDFDKQYLETVPGMKDLRESCAKEPKPFESETGGN
jgi:hypothetical protein